MNFNELSLSDELLSAVTEMGFTEATSIQEQSIPVIRTGADVLARSQTGTGKTVAFGIPAIECITPDLKGVQVLILSPTRELARQCGEQIRKLSRHLHYVKTADIFGGADYRNQFKELRFANIIIGTPGRIMDHIRRGTLDLTVLKMVVLDEADEMLNMGFREDIEFILQYVPQERQTVLFSATIPDKIREIAKRFQKKPVQIEINREQVTIQNIKQVYTEVPSKQKTEALSLLLHRYRPQRAIIFTNKKSSVDELVESLAGAGFSADGLHGDMKQNRRTAVMGGFRKGHINILVATDVAARGIDVSDVDYVVNFDIPQERDYYVHRIGRTGRAGRKGTAVTLCSGRKQVFQLKRLSREIKSQIEAIPLPTVADIEHINRKDALQQIENAINSKPKQLHREMIEELMHKGYTAENIAAALLDVYFESNTDNLVDIAQSEHLTKEIVVKNPHDMATIVFDIGYADKICVNHIVGAVTEHANISSRNIGKIRIFESVSNVEVAAEIAQEVLSSMQNRKIHGKVVNVELVQENGGFYKKRRKSGKKHRDNNKKNKSYGKRSCVKKGKSTSQKNGKNKKRR